MERSTILPAGLALGAGVFATLFFTQSPTPTAHAQDSFTRTDLNDVVIGHPDGTLVRVAGEGDVTVVPDIAVTDASFIFEAPTADAAQRDVNDRVTRYLRSLKRLGIPDTRIQTVGYTLRPRYDFSENRGRDPRIVGYVAQNTVRVRSDIEQLDEVIDEAFNNGVDQIARIDFEVEDEESAFRDALALATERAKGRAERIAASLGGTVTLIVEVSEPLLTRVPASPFARTAVRELASDATQSSPIAPGEEIIRASVEFSAVVVVN
ncbi:MAG: SIMPL domain-containing protein [Planctomycetota bacterium]